MISSSSSEVQPGTSHMFSTSESKHSNVSTPCYVTEVSQQYEASDDEPFGATYSFVTMQNL